MSSDCIFCKIIKKELSYELVKETDDIVAFKDINPKAAVHYLIVPKKHIKDAREITSEDSSLMANIFYVAQELSKGEDFRLVMNNGSYVGQSVFHMHIHFLSKTKMSDF